MIGVASLWNKNNVDWENIQKYRTSYIIRELYQACYELYSEAWNMTRFNTIPIISTPENYIFTNRDENALYEVYSMLLRKFADSPSYQTSRGEGGYVATGCFIDDNYIPSGSPNFKYLNGSVVGYLNFLGGVEHLTITKLEEYYGDMTFIRDLGFNQSLPFTEKIMRNSLMLPLNMTVTDDEVKYICKCVRDFYND